MNIDKFKRQHLAILGGIARLRDTAHHGVADNADAIAAQIIKLSATVKLHLAVEDSVLYPSIATSTDDGLARLGERYQREMDGIADDYFAFATRWNLADRLCADPEGFRTDANRVLRVLFERMKREDHDFYPAIEARTARARPEAP